MSLRYWQLGVVCALALSGCGAKPGSTSSSGTPAAASATADTSGCHAYQAGKDGVIRTFCDGPGTATLAIGATNVKLGGGSCEAMGQMFSFNAGVVVMPGPGAIKPDYVGLSVTNTGAFSHGVLSITYGGQHWGSTDIKGTVTKTGGTFEGPVNVSGTSQAPAYVTGSFTC
jgi:hypothetical protein